MRRVSILLVFLLAQSACRKAAKPEAEPPSEAAEAPAAVGTDAFTDEPIGALSAEVLDRFIAYERELLAAEAAIPRTAGKKDALAAVDRVARAEEELRKKHRLSEREVDDLERMMADVIDHRVFAKHLSLEALIAQGEQMREKLPPEQRADFEVELAEMRKEHETARSLAEERAIHGDANVELLLTREDDLTRLWNERLARWTGGTLIVPPRDAETAKGAVSPDAGTRAPEARDGRTP